MTVLELLVQLVLMPAPCKSIKYKWFSEKKRDNKITVFLLMSAWHLSHLLGAHPAEIGGPTE